MPSILEQPIKSLEKLAARDKELSKDSVVVKKAPLARPDQQGYDPGIKKIPEAKISESEEKNVRRVQEILKLAASHMAAAREANQGGPKTLEYLKARKVYLERLIVFLSGEFDLIEAEKLLKRETLREAIEDPGVLVSLKSARRGREKRLIAGPYINRLQSELDVLQLTVEAMEAQKKANEPANRVSRPDKGGWLSKLFGKQ